MISHPTDHHTHSDTPLLYPSQINLAEVLNTPGIFAILIWYTTKGPVMLEQNHFQLVHRIDLALSELGLDEFGPGFSNGATLSFDPSIVMDGELYIEVRSTSGFQLIMDAEGFLDILLNSRLTSNDLLNLVGI
jgi:hypothetical protein